MTGLRLAHRVIIATALIMMSGCNNPKAADPSASAAPNDTAFKKTETETSITLNKLADGVWMHTSAYRFPGGSLIPSNGLAIIDGDGLILVDTAWTALGTVELARQLKAASGLDIKKVVITHFHSDRIAGVDWLEAQGAEIYTHPQTPALAAQAGPPVPNSSVKELGKLGARVNLGPIEVGYPGSAHSPDNLVVYVKEAHILFGGCMIRAADSQKLGNLTDADLSHWPTSLQWVRAIYKDSQIVVPGHGNPGDKTLLSHTAALLARTVNSLAEHPKPDESHANELSGALNRPSPNKPSPNRP